MTIYTELEMDCRAVKPDRGFASGFSCHPTHQAVIIAGGNHAGFGWYGPINPATTAGRVSAAQDQQARTISEAILANLARGWFK